ncbi:MAG: ERF family protein [Aeriscardovia sp.]|nr:ERF family protein [Aeriscardovia sp.]
MDELHIVKKNRVASAGRFSYAYADLAAVIECIGKMGLEAEQDVQYAGENPFIPLGGVMVCGMVCTRTRKKGESQWGEWMAKVPIIVDMRQGSERQNVNQIYGSALSYARRYSFTLACSLATEDDDGQTASARKAPAYSSPVRQIRPSQSASSAHPPVQYTFEHVQQ